MTVLHIDSSARLNNSNTRIIGKYLVDALEQPVIHRDLGQEPLPSISAEDLMAVHSSSDGQRASLQDQLNLSDQLIDELIVATWPALPCSGGASGLPPSAPAHPSLPSASPCTLGSQVAQLILC